MAQAAKQDGSVLQGNGFDLHWVRREPAMYSAVARRHEDATKLEWVVDADFRFFPTVADDLFGYMLHPVDLATNKMMAAAGRREPRDVVDLLTIHDRILPVGLWCGRLWGNSLGSPPKA